MINQMISLVEMNREGMVKIHAPWYNEKVNKNVENI
jgi:hypothetical protein